MTSAYRDVAAPHCTRCTVRLDLAQYSEDGEPLCALCAMREQVIRDDRAVRLPTLTFADVVSVTLACLGLLFGGVFLALLPTLGWFTAWGGHPMP